MQREGWVVARLGTNGNAAAGPRRLSRQVAAN
jgi:hypothetical protein